MKYNRHSLALNDIEEAQFKAVHKSTGFGVKKIFMAMIKALSYENIQTPTENKIIVEEETV